MGGTIPRQLGQSYIIKLAEQAMGTKPTSAILPWFLLKLLPPGSCLKLLLWLPLIEINPLLSQVAFGQYFVRTTTKINQTAQEDLGYPPLPLF